MSCISCKIHGKHNTRMNKKKSWISAYFSHYTNAPLVYVCIEVRVSPVYSTLRLSSTPGSFESPSFSTLPTTYPPSSFVALVHFRTSLYTLISANPSVFFTRPSPPLLVSQSFVALLCISPLPYSIILHPQCNPPPLVSSTPLTPLPSSFPSLLQPQSSLLLLSSSSAQLPSSRNIMKNSWHGQKIGLL